MKIRWKDTPILGMFHNDPARRRVMKPGTARRSRRAHRELPLTRGTGSEIPVF
jgi:hypothetical protein